MPNYCYCVLTVSGHPSNVKQFMDFAKDDRSALSEERFMPYPASFRERDEECRKAFNYGVNSNAKDDPNILELQKAFRIKYNVPDDKIYPKDGYNSGGYEWCRNVWGTKWGIGKAQVNTDDLENGVVIYKFETAWVAPYPIIDHMANAFPHLIFKLDHHDEFDDSGEGSTHTWNDDYVMEIPRQ